jgi:hypothetical protein
VEVNLLVYTTTQLYDGTSWANNPTGLNTGRIYHGGVGTQALALAFGGRNFHLKQQQQKNGQVQEYSNKNNYSKLTGGKYGNKNIHRS